MLAVAAACTGPVDNSVSQAARGREVERQRLVLEGQQRESQLLTLTIAEDEPALRVLRDAAADLAARRRDALRSVAHEQQQLTAKEQQREALTAQLNAVAQDLEVLRAAIAEAGTKELRLRALQEQSAQLDVQLASAQQEFEAKAVAGMAKLAALREKLAQLAGLEAQWSAVLPTTTTPPPTVEASKQ